MLMNNLLIFFGSLGVGFYIFALITLPLCLYAGFSIELDENGNLNLKDFSIVFRVFHSILAWMFLLFIFHKFPAIVELIKSILS